MKRLFIIGLCFTAITVARADVLIVITTDADLNDNGGVDEFTPVPADGEPHAVYIWGASTPDGYELLEFNFDLNASGQSVAFSNASIGPTFSDLELSLSDTDLLDLQIGWSSFLDTPPTLLNCPTHTLLATLDVIIARDAVPGPDTTIDIGGPSFSILAPPLPGESIAIAGHGWSRNLRSHDDEVTCADLQGSCGDGVIQMDEDCDPPDGVSCDNNCLRIPQCGDGFLDDTEACDDGNTLTSDGCDAVCQLEPLLNDACADSQPVLDGQTNFYTFDATTDGPAHFDICQFDGQTYHDIWFDYQATCTGQITVSLCGSSYDTDLVVYDGCTCPVTAALACNDDGCPGAPPGAYRSLVTFEAGVGDCFKIRVGGWGETDAGAGVIDIACDHCDSDADCDDGLFCTGIETCESGVCQVESVPCDGQLCREPDETCMPIPPGDVDRDGDVDLNDLARFVRCSGGPGSVLPKCINSDIDGDGDADLHDYAILQEGFTGTMP